MTMTIRQLIHGRSMPRLLTEHDRQRAFLLSEWAKTPPCPHCGNPLALLFALKVDLEKTYEEEFPESRSIDAPIACPFCQMKIQHVLPWPAGSWRWVTAETSPSSALAALRELVASYERVGGPLSVEPALAAARAVIAKADEKAPGPKA